jgi:GT2 family glycosyltransferase
VKTFIKKVFSGSFIGWKENGFRGLVQQTRAYLRKQKQEKDYQKWILENEGSDREAIPRQTENFADKPLISIILPVYDVAERWLRLCLESVTGQSYPHWELCIADDASTKTHVRKVLEEYAAKDPRIKIIFRPENGHISAASNSALELAAGEWVILLDHDDELAPDALFHVAAEINAHPETRMIYSDEDLIDEKGARSAPKFKPDWSPDFFYSLNLITHLSAYHAELVKKIGGFRLGFEGSQDYDLALRAVEQISEKQIRHIPRVLYHWRAISGSVALDPEEKPYAHDRAKKALSEHFARKGISTTVTKGYSVLHRVSYDLPAEIKISLLFGGDKKAAEAILKNAGHKNVELVTVDAGPGSLAERLNGAAKKAGGEVLLFLKGGSRSVSENWLREMAGFALQKEIGAAGAKLLYNNGLIHHGGIILGINGIVGFAHRGLPRWFSDNFLRAQVANNFSAVSSACMATHREVFEELGGFDEENFANGLFDVDYCLRLREKGYRITWTPYAELILNDKTATENVIENKASKEVKAFRKKWGHLLGADPYYNYNLSLQSEDFAIRI